MSKIVRRFIDFCLRNARVRNYLTSRLLIEGELQSKLVTKFLRKYRSEIVAEAFMYPSIINNGFLHIERLMALLKNENSGPLLILDVGAAGGETVEIFSKSFPNCRIVGFEPIKRTFERLKKNTQNLSNVEIVNKALGSEAGEKTINITNRITSSSILETNEAGQFGNTEYFDIVEVEKITISTIDSLFKENIDAIKIDVQGFELEVLKGAIESLKRTKFVLLEMQNHSVYKGAPLYFDLDNFLREHGFVLFELIPSIRVSEQIKEYDAIYVNKNMTSP